MSRFEIWAATPAPFDAEGRLDVSRIPLQADHLRSIGVHGAFVNGTTGEFPAMTTDERRRVVEAWAQARPTGFGLAVQVGGTDLAQVTELAAHAESHGADFVATVTPYYGKVPNLELVVEFLQQVGAAAPETPLCYYHFPGMTGSPHLPSDIVARAADKVPTLSSVKFTDSDLMEVDRVRATRQGTKVYFGRDELLVPALSVGIDAVIGSLYNVLAPVAHQVVEAFDRGDHESAYALHKPFRDIANVADAHGGPGFLKELFNQLGPDCGVARTPWGPITEAGRTAVAGLVPGLRDAIAAAPVLEHATA
jgi:N-acetylneuraminate lyase